VKWRSGETTGRERKRRQGGVVSLARFTRVCPARGREEEGDVNSPVKLGSMLIPIQRQSPWSCWLVMNPVIVVQVL